VACLDEIVSFTVPQNLKSRRVMEKIGLRRRTERDFAHPKVDPVAHPQLVAHVLYSVTRPEWEADRAG
jgi:RimJ/RimL family protein N-acetyltransferase